MDKIESITFKRRKERELLTSLQARRSFLLFGPRQTGKSTILENLALSLPKASILQYYFQLPQERARVESDPDIIAREVEAFSTKPVFVLIDEIQKIPRIMDILQFLIDKRQIVLAATGSSARKMRTLGQNWLPGRITLEHLTPLSWEETGFTQQQHHEVLLYGALPGILAKKELHYREEDLTAYAHLYLEEEIRMEAMVRNIPRFAKFLRLVALESGTAPNFSKIGARVELSHTSIREYFQILEDTLIIHRIDAFGHKRDSVLRTSKYYFFDIGVRNAACGIGHSEGILTLQRGLLFEHFVLLELVAHFQQKMPIFYWRSKEGEEVDVVIEEEAQRIAIEIKATDKPNADDLQNLLAFQRKYKPKKAYIICNVPRPQKFGSIEAIPWSQMFEYL